MNEKKYIYGTIAKIKYDESNIFVKVKVDNKILGNSSSVADDSDGLSGVWIPLMLIKKLAVATGTLPNIGDTIKITYSGNVLNGNAELIDDNFDAIVISKTKKIGKDKIYSTP